MPSTKDKILEASLRLLNERGLKQTTLKLIADDVEISVGNLAYHYKNKAEIIAAHDQILEERLKETLSHFRNYPHFLDFHIQLEHIWQLLTTYQYVFCNLGEMKILYPASFQLVEDFYAKLTAQITHRLQFHIDREKIDLEHGDYIDSLPERITRFILTVPISNLFSKNHSRTAFFCEVWHFIRPVLNQSGKEEWNLLISPALIS
ncbi:MAG: TetR/AcrR family transcriptional regulator [Bacteroidota bacterium]